MTTTEPATGPRSRGASVIVNVLQVIRCFTVDEPWQGVTEIAARVGLHKSSVSRILAALEEENVVERDEASRKYRLGLGLIAVAGPLLANLDVRRIAMEDLRSLADRIAETTALAVWDGEGAVTVEQIPSRREVKHTSALGTRYDTGLSASVQVFLAHGDPATARALIESGRIRIERGLEVDDYLDRLSRVQTGGYAVNFRETSDEAVGIAAPVIDHRGEVVAAVLIAAPAFRIGYEDLPAVTADCRRAAAQISRRMGGSPAEPRSTARLRPPGGAPGAGWS